jgi:hypothetical protein
MDRAMLTDHLALAEKHVRLGQEHIAHQRELIVLLERHGHDTAGAKALLRQFEELQELHVADRDRLKRLL